MNKPARRFSIFSAVLAAAVLVGASLTAGSPASAQSLYNQPKYAAIVVDAASGEVLYARRADQPRYPASITKVMTAYLVFEAIATGRLSLTDPVPISRHAASQPPSKLGLRPGDSLTVEQAIQVIATRSANDIAVALAEKVGGTEARFAALMTLRAQELGMTGTRFLNASGLPDTRQISTARDLAILSRSVLRDFPQYYHYFGQTSISFRGQTINGHNRLLTRMPGFDGGKTGFTNASGYNLAGSAVRDGRRLLAVVLGGNSTAARDENMEELLLAGFDVLAQREAGRKITIAANMREPDDFAGPVMRPSLEQGSADQAGLRVIVSDDPAPVNPRAAAPRPPTPAPAAPKPTNRVEAATGPYRIQVGAFSTQRSAQAHLSKISSHYASVVASAAPTVEPGGQTYRARFAGFTQATARQACSALTARGEACLVVAPS